MVQVYGEWFVVLFLKKDHSQLSITLKEHRTGSKKNPSATVCVFLTQHMFHLSLEFC